MPISLPSETWDAEEKVNEEELQKIESYIRRRERIEAIRDIANNERIARCERKMAEVGKDEFMRLIHGWGGESGRESWSDFEGRTEIEIEYDRLRIEEHHEDWFREHGKPYRMEDDPNAKF